jgi:hypothetical protein
VIIELFKTVLPHLCDPESDERERVEELISRGQYGQGPWHVQVLRAARNPPSFLQAMTRVSVLVLAEHEVL